ncbi:hypothetical protein [Gabonibacter massiliensis]|uniref:hypothetical protein n=1 Tax=Gabonibacter massiliensis TaxID=1720195 RepID=UPI00073E85F3|nr:hypothetical protein [Gabonibacter massiliensis]
MILICLYSILFCILSCSDNINEIKPQDNKAQNEVQLKNGMLIISNYKVLEAIINGKQSINYDPFIMTFRSQRDVMDEIIEAESGQIDYLRTLNEVDLEKAIKHSKLYYKYLKEDFIKEVFYNDGSTSYDLNLATPYYAKVLNEKWYFAVGDTIYQVTPKYLKIWIGGDINRYTELNNYTSSDESRRIFVTDYSQKDTSIEEPLARTTYPITFYNITKGVYGISPYNERVVVIFYDKTNLLIAQHGYTRETYCRAIGQEPIPGTNSYSFKVINYSYNFMFGTQTAGVNDSFQQRGDALGYDDYYTVYLPYKMVVAGKTILESTDEFPYLSWFECIIYRITRVDESSTFQLRVAFRGERQTPTSGPFFYTFVNGSSVPPVDGGILEELIP